MKRDTAILVTIVILSLFCYVTDVLGKGGIYLFGTVLGISAIVVVTTSKPLENLDEQQLNILRLFKKYTWIISPLVVGNIILFYHSMPGETPAYKATLSVTTICGLISLIGYILGLIISVFPYKKMAYTNRLKRGMMLGLLSIQLLVMFIYLIALTQKK